jgi:hypothetical protein
MNDKRFEACNYPINLGKLNFLNVLKTLESQILYLMQDEGTSLMQESITPSSIV